MTTTDAKDPVALLARAGLTVLGVVFLGAIIIAEDLEARRKAAKEQRASRPHF